MLVTEYLRLCLCLSADTENVTSAFTGNGFNLKSGFTLKLPSPEKHFMKEGRSYVQSLYFSIQGLQACSQIRYIPAPAPPPAPSYYFSIIITIFTLHPANYFQITSVSF